MIFIFLLIVFLYLLSYRFPIGVNKEKIHKLPVYSYPPLSRNIDKYWIDFNVVISIHGFEISNGFFYFGSELEAARTAGCMEISLVDPYLEVSKPTNTFSSLGFSDYPNYRWWTPEQRYVYLSWLSCRTNVSEYNENIIKLYIIGIERRLISDYYHTRLSSESAIALIDELRRLSLELEIVHVDLYKRVVKLIDWAVFVHRESLHEMGYKPSYSESSTLFRYMFALISSGKGIGSDEAREWVIHNDPELVPGFLTSYSSYFQHFFNRQFNEIFPDGIKLNECDFPMHLCYNPIHPGISAVDVFLKSHTDPLWPSIHYKKLTKIFISSSEKTHNLVECLTKYSGDPLYLLKVISTLPQELAFDPDSQPFKSIHSFFSSLISDESQIRSIGVSELTSFLSGADQLVSDNIIVQSESLITLETILTHMGFSIAPSPSRFNYSYTSSDSLIVYAGNMDCSLDLYLEISTFVTIMHGLSNSLGSISTQSLLEKVVTYFPDADIIGDNALRALCEWALITSKPTKGSDKRFGALSDASKYSLYLCLRSSLEDIVLPRSYKNNLISLYTLLGKGRDTLSSDMKLLNITFN